MIVTSLDRLSRKKEDIKAELQYFKENNIRLKILDIPTTLIDPPEGQEWIFDMVLNILIEVMLFDETGRIFNDLNGWCMLPYKFIDIMKKIVKMINKMPAMSILFLLYCIK